MNVFLRIFALIVDAFVATYVSLCVVLIIFFPPMSVCLCAHLIVINYKMIAVFYFVLLCYAFLSGRRTYGKRLFRLQIIDKRTLMSANSMQIIKRNFIFIGSFGLSYIWLIFSKGQFTLHDKLSNTTVIRDKT